MALKWSGPKYIGEKVDLLLMTTNSFQALYVIMSCECGKANASYGPKFHHLSRSAKIEM